MSRKMLGGCAAGCILAVSRRPHTGVQRGLREICISRMPYTANSLNYGEESYVSMPMAIQFIGYRKLRVQVIGVCVCVMDGLLERLHSEVARKTP
jgi:hypothetical protein